MVQSTDNSDCKRNCWIGSAIAGIILAILLMAVGDWNFFPAVFAGFLALVILGFLLTKFLCTEASSYGGDAQAERSGATGAAVAGAGAVAAAGAAAASSASASSAAATSSTAATTSAAAGAADTTPAKAFEMQPSGALAGQDELASRKGDWKYEAEAKPAAKKPAAKKPAAKKAPAKKVAAKSSGSKTTASKAASAKATGSKTGSGKAAASKTGTAKAAASKTTAAKGAGTKAATGKAATAKSAATKSGAAKTTGTKAAGTKAAAAKPAAAKAAKGKATGTKSAAAKSTAAKAAPAKAKRAAVAADGKPATLKKARASGADDLKLISGVGPKLEGTLNEMGFYHFDQVAGWRKKEIEWVDSRLKFKGRIERDNWMAQAKILAKGGETEFSKRSKK